MRRLLLKHFLLVRINKMPSLHKKRSAPKKAGRKSHRKSPRKSHRKSPRNSHRKSPRHVKSGHKRSKSGRRVRGGADLDTNWKYKAATAGRTLASGLVGATAGLYGVNTVRGDSGNNQWGEMADNAGAVVGGLGMGYREYTRNVGKYSDDGKPVISGSGDAARQMRSY